MQRYFNICYFKAMCVHIKNGLINYVIHGTESVFMSTDK